MTFSKQFCATLVALSVCAPQAFSADPLQTDGDKYKLKFENEKIRVLEYQDVPGAKTQEHHHPNFFLYAISPFKRKIALPGGKNIMREFKEGDMFWSDEQTHIGENVGTTPTHVLIVEVK